MEPEADVPDVLDASDGPDGPDASVAPADPRKRALLAALTQTQEDTEAIAAMPLEQLLSHQQAIEQEQAAKRTGARPLTVTKPPIETFAGTIFHRYSNSSTTHYMEWNNFKTTAWATVKNNTIEIIPWGILTYRHEYGARFDPWSGEKLPSAMIRFKLPSWLRINDNAPVEIDAGRTGDLSTWEIGPSHSPIINGAALRLGYVLKPVHVHREGEEDVDVGIELHSEKVGGFYVHMRVPEEECRVWPRDCLTAWDVARRHKPLQKMVFVLRWMRNVAKIKEERRIHLAQNGVLEEDAIFVKRPRVE